MATDKNSVERAAVAVVLTADLVERLMPALDVHLDHPVRGHVVHAYATMANWLLTLRAIKHASLVEASAAATRGAFEAFVDVVLLTDKPERVETIAAWERSAALQAIEAVLTFYRETKEEPPPDRAPAWFAFVEERRDAVRADRVSRWPKARDGKPRTPNDHPDRWTGRSFIGDIIEADKLRGDHRLRELYEVEIRSFQFMLHGSGFPLTQRFDGDAYRRTASRAWRIVVGLVTDATRILYDFLPDVGTPERRAALGDLRDTLVRVFEGAHPQVADQDR